jgi:hypothetical protein
LDMGHTLGREHAGENRERKGNLKFECGWFASCRGTNKAILNWQRPLWEGDQDVGKKSGRKEPMWVAIHKWMESMLGISLYLYLKLAKSDMLICLSYHLLCFPFNIIRKEKAGTSFIHVSKCTNDKRRKNI